MAALAWCVLPTVVGAAPGAPAPPAAKQSASKEAKEEVHAAAKEGREKVAAAKEEAKEKVGAAKQEMKAKVAAAKEDLREARAAEGPTPATPSAEPSERGRERRHHEMGRMHEHVKRPSEIPPPIREALRMHARRVARLTRIRTLAEAAGDKKSAAECDKLLALANEHHEKHMSHLWHQHEPGAGAEGAAEPAAAAPSAAAPAAAPGHKHKHKHEHGDKDDKAEEAQEGKP